MSAKDGSDLPIPVDLAGDWGGGGMRGFDSNPLEQTASQRMLATENSHVPSSRYDGGVSTIDALGKSRIHRPDWNEDDDAMQRAIKDPPRRPGPLLRDWTHGLDEQTQYACHALFGLLSEDLRQDGIDFAIANEDTLLRSQFLDSFGDYLLDQGRLSDYQQLEDATRQMAAIINAACAISGGR